MYAGRTDPTTRKREDELNTPGPFVRFENGRLVYNLPEETLVTYGEYVARLVAAGPRTAANGRDGFGFWAEITEGQYRGGTRVWDQAPMEDFPAKWRQILGALVGPARAGAGDIEIDDLIGRQCVIIVGQFEWKGEMRNCIEAWLPLTNPPVIAAA